MFAIVFSIILCLAAVGCFCVRAGTRRTYYKRVRMLQQQAGDGTTKVKVVPSATFTPSTTYKALLPAAVAAIVIAVIVMLSASVVSVNPDQIAFAYTPSGTSIRLHTGYNLISPLARKGSVSTKAEVTKFSEGEAADDIFGAQTAEKDYITIVATISYRVDAARIEEYVTRYGYTEISNEKIYAIVKTTARSAIEHVISVKNTADVMSNKSAISDEAATAFVAAMQEFPVIIDSITIDDLVAPESYEATIKEQAVMRQRAQTAELQKDLNAKEAEALKIKNEGEAAANKIKAEGEAAVNKVNAENSAEIARINAEKEASVKKIAAENSAEVLKISSEAEAEKTKVKAEADALAVKVAGEAEAAAAEALAKVYETNPEMYELKKAEIVAEVQHAWAEKWSGLDLSGISPTISYADISALIQGIIDTAIEAE